MNTNSQTPSQTPIVQRRHQQPPPPPNPIIVVDNTPTITIIEHEHNNPDSDTLAVSSAIVEEETISSRKASLTSATMGSKRVVGAIIRTGRRPSFVSNYLVFTRSKPSLFHAIVVIFLEFFAWGLLTLPAITVLNTTFPEKTFLMNGLIMGVKGFLSFLSAPLIGALSDLWGRKFFLLITVFFTCLPIPFMKFSPSLYFGLVIISGIFSVTFSVIFAYVADITEEHERSHAYGWVTATFALSLITSPALGAFISSTLEDDNLVIVLATGVAIFDFIYILFFVPESLPEKLRQKSVSFWESADPFSSLRRAGKDRMILTLCVAVFLSYLPEAGQYSCFFVYLKLIIGFSQVQVAAYIAFIGVTSVFAQTVLLTVLMKRFGSKNTIMIGLIFEMLQLICFGLGSSHWVVWSAGIIAATGTITYPAISAYVSTYADADKQGLVQGIITGIRGLCNGLGPCFFGLIFSLFNVDLVRQSEQSSVSSSVLISPADTQSLRHMMPSINQNGSTFIHFLNSTTNQFFHSPTDQVIPGPPFLFGALLVLLAILVMAFIPELVQFPPSTTGYGDSYITSGSYKPSISRIMSPTRSSRTAPSTNNYYYKNMQHQTDKDNQCCSIVEPTELNDVKLLRQRGGSSSSGTTALDPITHRSNLDDRDIVMIDEKDYVVNCALSSLSSAGSTCNLSSGSESSSNSSSSSEGDSDIDSKQRLISPQPSSSSATAYQLDQKQPQQYQNLLPAMSVSLASSTLSPHVHNTIVMSTHNHRTTTAIHRPMTNIIVNNDNNETKPHFQQQQQNKPKHFIPTSIIEDYHNNNNPNKEHLKVPSSSPTFVRHH